MDKMGVMVPSGNSGPTHRARVGGGGIKYPDCLFCDKVPAHTDNGDNGGNKPGNTPETMASASGDPNMFVHRDQPKNTPSFTPFLVQIWVKSRLVWLRHK